MSRERAEVGQRVMVDVTAIGITGMAGVGSISGTVIAVRPSTPFGEASIQVRLQGSINGVETVTVRPDQVTAI
jgi:hypothetical protein